MIFFVLVHISLKKIKKSDKNKAMINQERVEGSSIEKEQKVIIDQSIHIIDLKNRRIFS